MTETSNPTAVSASIEVNAAAQRAFEVFTRDFGAFKPAEHNLLAVPIVETSWRPTSADTSSTAVPTAASAPGPRAGL